MKKTIITILFLVIVSVIVYGENSSPQLAYRFLDDYITNQAAGFERGRKIGAGITMGLGLTLLGTAGGLYFWGDDFFSLFTQDSSTIWEPETRNIVCLSLAGAGVASIGTSLIMLSVPPENFRQKYSYIYTESDPLVQEALSAAALADMADTAKNRRISNGIVDLCTPLLFLIINIAINITSSRPWYQDTNSSSIALSVNLFSGLSELFWEKTDEERLYEKYRHAKEAMLVSDNRLNGIASIK